jgi:hypothetical protein
VDTLTASGRLTGPGEIFVSGIDRTLLTLEQQPVSARAMTCARKANADHHAAWVCTNGMG